MKKPKRPKILFFDIETSPNVSATWGKWKQDVPAFFRERELLSVAYAWNDGPIKVVSREGKSSDKELCTFIASLLRQADMTVAHYGDKFDRPFVKTRMLNYGLAPLKHNCSVDTKAASSSYFNFNGNSLQDVCNYLGIGKKLPHQGIQMWLDCMQDKPKAWAHMCKYNNHDVVLLRDLYNRLKPWIENHPNLSKMLDPYRRGLGVCPLDPNHQVIKYGLRPTASRVSQRWLCTDCGKHFLTRLNRKAK